MATGVRYWLPLLAADVVRLDMILVWMPAVLCVWIPVLAAAAVLPAGGDQLPARSMVQRSDIQHHRLWWVGPQPRLRHPQHHHHVPGGSLSAMVTGSTASMTDFVSM